MTVVELIVTVGGQVASSLIHNWPFLATGIVSAAALKVYVGIERVATLFRRRTAVAVVGSVTAAVAFEPTWPPNSSPCGCRWSEVPAHC